MSFQFQTIQKEGTNHRLPYLIPNLIKLNPNQLQQTSNQTRFQTTNPKKASPKFQNKLLKHLNPKTKPQLQTISSFNIRTTLANLISQNYNSIQNKTNETTCSSAAEHGHLHILQWVRENKCQWDKMTCVAAVEGGFYGHLHILQ